jgi:hypothetical protein
MNDELTNKIIERIETEQITPLPRWRFILLRELFWSFAILSIIIGSFAVGVMLFLFFDYSNHGLPAIPQDLNELLLLIPYIWLVVFVLFIIIGRESIRRTSKGYRYHFYVVILASVFLSFVFGSILDFAGVGKMTHEFFNNRVPVYNYATYDSMDAWNRPAVGRLAGVVVSAKRDKNNFFIIDLDGHLWHIYFASSTNDLYIPEASSTVRILGFFDPKLEVFVAKSITEWE